ncbi:MAG: hypothetical protein ACLTCQ_02680 [Enterocloster bolteae]
MKERLSLKRWEDFEQGYPEYIPSFPEEPIDAVPEECRSRELNGSASTQ